MTIKRDPTRYSRGLCSCSSSTNDLELSSVRVFCWTLSLRTGRHVGVVNQSRALHTLYTVESRSSEVASESRNKRCPHGWVGSLSKRGFTSEQPCYLVPMKGRSCECGP